MRKALSLRVSFDAVGSQMAVAQVVIHRVFSGSYPNNIYSVVYQNGHHDATLERYDQAARPSRPRPFIAG
jgi:hypothetical protein